MLPRGEGSKSRCTREVCAKWLAFAVIVSAGAAAPAMADVFAIAAQTAMSAALPASPEGPVVSPGRPAEPTPSPVPDDATLEANGAVIGEVAIKAGDIFDPEKPGEGNLLFRAANKLHVKTRVNTIRHLLLFKTGDPYSRRVLDESERTLRATGYLYDARIHPIRYDGERVDVVVETRDVWTLSFGPGLGRAGGATDAHFSLEDRNFFGSGKDVSVRWSRDVDRTQTVYRYRDPNLFGTWARLGLWYSDLSDGKNTAYALERPFYCLSSRWALGVRTSTDDRTESLYSRGVITSQFRHQTNGGEAYGGISRGLVNGRARRLTFGLTYEKDQYAVPAGLAVPAPSAPPGRTLAYPWIGFDEIQDGFFTALDMDQIQRTEDHNLGREVHARLGYSAPAFGGDRGRVIYKASVSQGLNPGTTQTLFMDADLSGRWGGDGAENLLLSGEARYFVRNIGEHVFYVSLSGDVAHNLDAENQLLLGGDTGLRGYPLRYQDGDRRVLLTVEQRFYMPWHILKLVHVGAAVFYDAGSAWWAGNAKGSGQPLLQDAGVGLRLSSSRSAKGGMVHLDVAFPIDPPDGVPHSQLYVRAGDTF